MMNPSMVNDSLPYESLFIIDLSNPLYGGDVLMYLQTQWFLPQLS